MPLSGRNERNAKGQYLPGVSGNPGGEPGWIRKRFTDFLTAFHDHFQREGRRVIAKVAKQQPAATLGQSRTPQLQQTAQAPPAALLGRGRSGPAPLLILGSR